MALTFAYYGETHNWVSDPIPDEIWDDLAARGLVETLRDHTDEGYTSATAEGRDLLRAIVEGV